MQMTLAVPGRREAELSQTQEALQVNWAKTGSAGELGLSVHARWICLEEMRLNRQLRPIGQWGELGPSLRTNSVREKLFESEMVEAELSLV